MLKSVGSNAGFVLECFISRQFVLGSNSGEFLPLSITAEGYDCDRIFKARMPWEIDMIHNSGVDNFL